MKIKRMHIHNYRGIADLEIAFKPGEPLIVTGPNGIGKSTIYGALGYLLGETNQAFDKDAPILHLDAKVGFVEADLASDDTVRRSFTVNDPPKLEVEGVTKKAGKRGAEQRLCELAGISSAADAALCLRPDLFLRLRKKDQSELFYTLLRVTVTKDLVAERVGKLEEDTGLPIWETFNAHKVKISTNLDSTKDVLFAARTIAKRNLKEESIVLERYLQQESEGECPAFVEEPDHAEIKRLEDEGRKWLREQSRLVAVADEIERTKTLIANRKASLEGAPTKAALAKAEKRMIEIEEGMKKHEEAAAEYKQLSAELNKLFRAGKTCHACGKPTDNKARMNEIEVRIARLAGDAEAYEKLVDARLKGQQWLSGAKQYEVNQGLLDAAQERMKELGPAPDFSETEEGLRAVDELLENLRDQQREWYAWTSWNEKKTASQERVNQLTTEVKSLAELVNLFSATGLKAEVLRRASKPVEDKLSSTLALWDMKARLSDELVLEVERYGLWRPSTACSAGELLLVALALQVWLAEVTGLRILCVDGVEQLDPENRKLMFVAVQDLLDSEAVDHAIVCGMGLTNEGALDLSEKPAKNSKKKVLTQR